GVQTCALPIWPLSEAPILGQGPSSNARRAAEAAASTSVSSASATQARVSPVAGLVVSKVRPERASDQRPPMKILPAGREAEASSDIGVSLLSGLRMVDGGTGDWSGTGNHNNFLVITSTLSVSDVMSS